MRTCTTVATICCILASMTSSAQSPYIFKKGLIAPLPSRYGREAIYTDELAYQLYTGTLKRPAAGDTAATNEKGQAIIWQPIGADSSNRLFLPRTMGMRGAPAGPGVVAGALRGGIGMGGSYIYLTYESPKAQVALLNVKGNSGVFVNGEQHTGDPYSMGFLYIPVQLKKGLNEFYLRGATAVASLHFPAKAVAFNTEDLTLPHIVLDQQNGVLQGGIVVLNAAAKPLKGLLIKTILQGKQVSIGVPDIPALASRKIPFSFDGSAVSAAGKYEITVSILDKGKLLDEKQVSIEAVVPSASHSSTFISDIDGSLQYYGVTPQSNTETNDLTGIFAGAPAGKPGNALFFSVHGAGVEAIGQARAYKAKNWGTLVAPTNRRPRGFNWEDWGRLDALEVLDIAKNRFHPDPQNIYLTGHSMGGHGTWFLGATYPDKWAAIAPCAGYPTLKGYGSADGLIPDSSGNALEQVLLRAGNQSDVPKLATNYKPLGVYIFHGDDDRTVSVNYARQMRKLLGEFHPDLSYHEFPGGGHWFGDHSVDWKPIFDFFKWHHREADSAINTIDFKTASPGISASYRWATILQQQMPLEYSQLQLARNKAAKTITGTTGNTRLLKLQLADFPANTTIAITIDQSAAINYTTRSQADSVVLLKQNNTWQLSAQPGFTEKGPHRYGTLKDAFNHKMVFVYGTTGTKEENAWSLGKAIFDAETWYYRGNGAVDIVADKAYTTEKFKDRGVVLYGNKTTNSAYAQLLAGCPIQVERNKITAADKSFTGDDLAAYLVWPIASSNIASVAVIGGTGVKGMNAASANQYFAGASGFPDYMIYDLEMLKAGASRLKMAGFFDNNWQLTTP